MSTVEFYKSGATGSQYTAAGEDNPLPVTTSGQPANSWGYAAAGIASSTADVLVKAGAGTGLRNYIKSMQLSAAVLSADTTIVIKDGGAVVWRGLVSRGINNGTLIFDPPLRGSVNTPVNVALEGSVTGSVYANLQGYTGV